MAWDWVSVREELVSFKENVNLLPGNVIGLFDYEIKGNGPITYFMPGNRTVSLTHRIITENGSEALAGQ